MHAGCTVCLKIGLHSGVQQHSCQPQNITTIIDSECMCIQGRWESCASILRDKVRQVFQDKASKPEDSILQMDILPLYETCQVKQVLAGAALMARYDFCDTDVVSLHVL